MHTFSFIVIPAKAGIHHPPLKFNPPVMDPRLRGGDEKVEH
ncbi:hypothetical protein [Sphingorhabdus sp.]|jgi:hypothetical protein|nr:hypothetical protein [Sphingorhabdus sp.]HMT40602.1 hypothetical protein [Sphingorhabdus sp.]